MTGKFNPVLRLSATELIVEFKAKRLSPSQVLALCLERVAQCNESIRAICTPNENASLAALKSDRRYSGHGEIRPLEGVPFVVKDVIQTKGIRTTFGSKIFETNIPEEDAVSVERLLSAGAVLLGKANTPEFAHDVFTNNKMFGATRNPRNAAYTAGGSSGGTAAAIAAGMAPIGLGTDLGGSIRVPAAMCGIVGLRATTGRVPVWPSDFGWDTLVAHVHGPMTRSVEDIGLMMSILAGPDARDPSSLPSEAIDWIGASKGTTSLKGRRIAFSADLNGVVPVDDEIADLAREALGVFREQGCSIHEACFDATSLFGVMAGTRGYGMVARYTQLVEKHREMMAPHMIGQVEDALKLDIRAVTDAERARTTYWHSFRRFMENYDYFITPVIGATAWKIDEPLPTIVGGRTVNKFYDAFRLPYAFSIIGVPAIAVPTRETSKGLPVGIQIIGQRFTEARVLEAASSYLRSKPEWVTDPAKTCN